MNALGASPLLLSLIATAASLPFFFYLAGRAVADLRYRRNLLVAVYLWLAAAAGRACSLYLAALGTPVHHPDLGLFAGNRFRV